MKKSFGLILLILSFLGADATIAYVKGENNKIVNNKIVDIKAVYISYLEYYDNFYGGSIKVNKAKIDKMIDNVKDLGLNTIILHVSPFSDSIYNSKIFPYSSTLTGIEGKNPGFDYLDYFIYKTHQDNMLIYAWINPYRISFNSNIDNLCSDNPALKFINTSNIKIDKNGIYYNPASELVKDLIVNQVFEIISNYNVDGIHFDDYFYIQDDIDKLEYENYIKNNEEISLKEFRLNNTNDLIKKVYKLIKDKNNKVVFSIAPDGNINNNYLYHYADVKTWLSNIDYIDTIMPQIYYGFENEYAPFDKVFDNWKELIKNNNINMVPVLAIYKSGNIDDNSGSGKNEWLNNSNLIERQINYLKLNNVNSYALFRYDYLFSNKYLNDISVKEIENLKNINQKYG